MSQNDLFSAFEKTDPKDWDQRLEKELKGRNPNEILNVEIAEGVSSPAIVHHGERVPADRSFFTKDGRHWLQTESFDANHPHFERDMAQAIENDVQQFIVHGECDVKAILDKLDLSWQNMIFTGSSNAGEIILDTLQARKLDPATHTSCVIGGEVDDALPLCRTHEVVQANMGDPLKTIQTALNRGKKEFQGLLDSGVSVDNAAPRLQFQFDIGEDLLPWAAALRAFKLAWAGYIERLQPEHACSRHTHVLVSTSYPANIDPYTSMISATTQALSAVWGNCDSLEIRPFAVEEEHGRDFSRRIARNVQHLIRDEGMQWRSADPTAGA